MTVFLGIDPGLATMGFGVIEATGDFIRQIDAGIIKTPPSMALAERLNIIKKDMDQLLAQYKPQAVGVEELFFAKNVTNAIKVAHARGVVLQSVAACGIPLFEFTPLEVKNNICGYGQADKKQMQGMVKRLLQLKHPPEPDDAADALGVACSTARAFDRGVKISLVQ